MTLLDTLRHCPLCICRPAAFSPTSGPLHLLRPRLEYLPTCSYGSLPHCMSSRFEGPILGGGLPRLPLCVPLSPALLVCCVGTPVGSSETTVLFTHGLSTSDPDGNPIKADFPTLLMTGFHVHLLN